MSTATAKEMTPARPRTLTRAARKRDERVRRLVRWIKKSATFLDKPHYAPLLRIYAETVIDRETLRANVVERYENNYLDELGHAIPALETLQRLAKACASIGSQLGLAPGAERAMRQAMSINADHSKWLAIADGWDEDRRRREEVVTASTSPEAAANGTSMPGFTAPA
jgi:hypothetical protein